MKKDFKVIEFAKQYEEKLNNNDRATFLKTKLKVENYIEYAEKVLIAENIVRSSSYAISKDKDSGELMETTQIHINSPMRYVLFVMSIVNKYTNIEVNFNNIMIEFDALNRNGLLELIMKKIGDKEITEFQTVVDMILNDFMTNEYEFKNYISGLVVKAGGVVEKIVPLVENITNKLDSLSDEDADKFIRKWKERVSKFAK